MTEKAKQELMEKAMRDEQRLTDIELRTKEGVLKAVKSEYKKNGKRLPVDVQSGGMRAIYEMARRNVEEFEGKADGEPRYQTLDELKRGIQGYWDFLISQVDSEDELIADTEGLCQFLGISRRTLLNWEKQNYNGFANLIAETRTAIAACNKQIAKKGKMPALVFMADFNNNHEYVQKQQVEIENHQLSQDKMTPEQLKAALDGMAEAQVESELDNDFNIEDCFTPDDEEDGEGMPD